jgi:hypothetical protein
VLGTAGGLARLAGRPVRSGRDSGPETSLDEAEQRADALEARYELALVLATRSVLARISGTDDQQSAARAEAIFSALGVQQAVITWSSNVARGPLCAWELAHDQGR